MSYPDAEGNIIDIYVHRMKYEIVNDATGEGWFFPDTDNDMVALTKGEDGMWWEMCSAANQFLA